MQPESGRDGPSRTGRICLDGPGACSDIGARCGAGLRRRYPGGMLRILRLLVWTLAWVGFWASAEQSAFAPAAEVFTVTVRPAPVLPDGTWAKLRALFSEAPAEAGETLSRKGRP